LRRSGGSILVAVSLHQVMASGMVELLAAIVGKKQILKIKQQQHQKYLC